MTKILTDEELFESRDKFLGGVEFNCMSQEFILDMSEVILENIQDAIRGYLDAMCNDGEFASDELVNAFTDALLRELDPPFKSIGELQDDSTVGESIERLKFAIAERLGFADLRRASQMQ